MKLVLKNHDGPHRRVLSTFLLAALAACADPSAPDPLLLEILDGDAQEALAGTSVANPLRVRITTVDGKPRSNVRVEWTVTEGGGRIESVGTGSDAGGIAQAHWTLGDQGWHQSVKAAVDGESAPFYALASPADWMEVLEIQSTAGAEGDSIFARFELINRWAGTLRLWRPDSCLGSPYLYDPSGERIWSPGFDTTCLTWVVTNNLAPGESLTRRFGTVTKPLEAGVYTVRIQFKSLFKVNDRPVALPDLEMEVFVGG
ncbi:MAG: hypothetical protein E4G90_03715 [Gemmatimonadales bacterium]|nr:MAG: hypothetical protein E4G90_03715 [Gemmatimonadales bacterium]